jgi:hypothetical protein
MAQFAKSRDLGEDVVGGMRLGNALEESKCLAREESLELWSVHRPILSARHELALVLREC